MVNHHSQATTLALKGDDLCGIQARKVGKEWNILCPQHISLPWRIVFSLRGALEQGNLI